MEMNRFIYFMLGKGRKELFNWRSFKHCSDKIHVNVCESSVYL